MLTHFRQDCVILKPDKGNGIALIKKNECNLVMKKLFSVRSKFKIIQEVPTLTRLITVQNYVNTMFKRNEISEEEKEATTTDGSAIRTSTWTTKKAQSLC